MGLVNPDGNRWVGTGGAAYLQGFEYGEVNGVLVDKTRVGRHGGGVYFNDVAYVWAWNSTFQNVRHGHPTAGGSSFGGGILALYAVEVLVQDATFRNMSGADPVKAWHVGSAISLRVDADPDVKVKRAWI